MIRQTKVPKARSKLWPAVGRQRDALESHVREESFALGDLRVSRYWLSGSR